MNLALELGKLLAGVDVRYAALSPEDQKVMADRWRDELLASIATGRKPSEKSSLHPQS